jgi:CBS domain-containing protein
MVIADVMTREVYTCGERETARDALALMWEHDVGALPIVDDDQQVLGMVTDRDLAMAGLHRGAPPHKIPVTEVTTGKVWSVAPDDPLDFAERMMEQHQVRRLPVLDEGARLVGVITLADLVRARSGVMPSEVTRTLAAITTPRTLPVPTA